MKNVLFSIGVALVGLGIGVIGDDYSTYGQLGRFVGGIVMILAASYLIRYVGRGQNLWR